MNIELDAELYFKSFHKFLIETVVNETKGMMLLRQYIIFNERICYHFYIKMN